MKFIADFHIHSKYSRATSKNIDLVGLEIGAQKKGIKVIGTGDFTHPGWFNELKNNLQESEPGLFLNKHSISAKEDKDRPRFILTSEISCIYKKNDRVRKIHIVLIAPSLKVVEKINNTLGEDYNLKSDGRPILGLDAEELLKTVLDISPDILFVPAHCFTPWFSIFGSKSGFNSVQECFGESSKYIYALETGLSADPAMIWMNPDGQRLTLLSNSDAHSVEKLGREANVFDANLDYFDIVDTIKKKDNKRFLNTIEFYPQEGKYYYDGHMACSFSCSPQESKKYGNKCPKCGQNLIIGVLNRSQEIADKPYGFIPEGAIPYKNIVPLPEIITQALGLNSFTKKAEIEYNEMIQKIGPEFHILVDAPLEEVYKKTRPEIAQGIEKVRKGDVAIIPGYDGVFGKVGFSVKKETLKPQQVLGI